MSTVVQRKWSASDTSILENFKKRRSNLIVSLNLFKKTLLQTSARLNETILKNKIDRITNSATASVLKSFLIETQNLLSTNWKENTMNENSLILFERYQSMLKEFHKNTKLAGIYLMFFKQSKKHCCQWVLRILNELSEKEYDIWKCRKSKRMRIEMLIWKTYIV